MTARIFLLGRVPAGLMCARMARRLCVSAPRLTSAQIGRPSNFTVRVIGIIKPTRSGRGKKLRITAARRLVTRTGLQPVGFCQRARAGGARQESFGNRQTASLSYWSHNVATAIPSRDEVVIPQKRRELTGELPDRQAIT